MCLRFVLLATLRDVKLHSKKSDKESDATYLYTGEDCSEKRQV